MRDKDAVLVGVRYQSTREVGDSVASPHRNGCASGVKQGRALVGRREGGIPAALASLAPSCADASGGQLRFLNEHEVGLGAAKQACVGRSPTICIDGVQDPKALASVRLGVRDFRGGRYGGRVRNRGGSPALGPNPDPVGGSLVSGTLLGGQPRSPATFGRQMVRAAEQRLEAEDPRNIELVVGGDAIAGAKEEARSRAFERGRVGLASGAGGLTSAGCTLRWASNAKRLLHCLPVSSGVVREPDVGRPLRVVLSDRSVALGVVVRRRPIEGGAARGNILGRLAQARRVAAISVVESGTFRAISVEGSDRQRGNPWQRGKIRRESSGPSHNRDGPGPETS